MTRDTDLIRRAVDLIEGDLTGIEWKKACREFCRDAKAHLPAPVLVPPSPGVTAGATGMVADDSLNARLHEVGNQIHNIACEHQSNEDMVERLGDLRAEIWAIAAMLPATPAPVVPAEGLDSERLVAAWLAETEGFASRHERLMDDILAECDLAPWLHAACQVGIDAALCAQQPAAPVRGVTVQEAGWQPIETAPRDGTEVLMFDPNLGMAVWPSNSGRWPNVTHWMPLPEPPALSALEGK